MKPAFTITANDKDVTDLIRDRLLSLTVTDEAGFESDTVEVRLDNRDLKIAPPTTGAELRVSLGYVSSGVYEMGLYVVDEYERSGLPHELLIRARSAYGGDGKKISETVSGITAALKEQRTRSWDQRRLGGVVDDVAKDCGLKPAVSPDLGRIMIEHIDQTNESNSHFLQRLAREYDAVFKPNGGVLIFVPKALGRTATGQQLPEIFLSLYKQKSSESRICAQLTGESGCYRLTVAERANFKSVRAYYHDVAAAERKEIFAGSGEPIRTMRGNYASPEEAARAADAELRRIGRGSAAPTFSCHGEPRIRAEATVTVDDSMGSDLAGSWSVTRAEHTFDDRGYATSIECESPEAGK
ncbi:MAG: contractile injection system protein, VgrG/Pvc8 family [Kiritimatiellales bacterium]